MNSTELAAILALAEQGVKDAAALYRFFAGKVSGSKTLEEVLTDADMTYQAVIDAATKELQPQQPAPVPPASPSATNG